MADAVIRKLEGFARLSKADRRLIEETCHTAHDVGPRQDLIREGENPRDVQLILEGFACRYKLLADGRRHIMAYLLPGDFCDLHVFILRTMDHSIATLSPCRVAPIPCEAILNLMDRPAIARAMWWTSLVDEAVLREWLVNIGARSAEQRVAHLLCELLFRLRAVGLTADAAYGLPLTQIEIADSLGLTHIHVNRIFQRLRAEGAITFKGKRLVILDEARLMEFSDFDPNYLHLGEHGGTKEPQR